MIAVVTGSSGFIGAHLVNALLERGATVRALYRPATPNALRDPRVDAYEADLLVESSVRQCHVWHGATHVFHLAGRTRGRTLAEFRDGNVFPTAHVLSALAARAGHVPRVVVASSQAAAGPARDASSWVTELDRARPVEHYGRSKLQAEQAVLRHNATMPIAVVRPSAVYGPGDRDFLAAFRQVTRPFALHAAPSHHLFSIVHVRDLVSALLLAAEMPAAIGRTYFVANREAVSWRELYGAIAAAAGTRPWQLQLPLAALRAVAAAGDLVAAATGWRPLLSRNKVTLASAPWWLCDASRARAELGWHPRVPLQDGVRETYLWYRAQGWLSGSTRAAATPSGEEPTR